MALTRRCPASLAGRRALAPRIWGGRAHALIGYPGLRPTSPRTPGRGPARPFHGPLRETRNGHTPVTRAVPFVCIRWTNLFRFAQSFIGTNSVLRSKVYLRTIRLNTDAYLRGGVIARRKSCAPRYTQLHARRGAVRGRDVPRRRRRRTSRRPDCTHSHTAHRRGTRPHEHPQ